LGIKFHFGTPVDRVVVEDGRAVGIAVDGQIHHAEVVVSNVDIVPTYRKLLRDQEAPEQTLNQPRSSSALIFYWGVKKEFPELDVHNIFFTEDYQAEFAHIWEKKSLYHDPTVYIHISSKKHAADAPVGGENWFTMINVPHDAGQDWDQLIETARTSILEKVSKMLGKKIQPYIEVEHILEPRTIQSRTGSFLGALYGNSSNNRFAAFLRHPNFSRKIKNLYFCGGSVHPGGGIPLCLLSARIVGDLVNQQHPVKA
ncbi:MAG: phytoene desaturase, partial [Bacteroidota bacterium]